MTERGHSAADVAQRLGGVLLKACTNGVITTDYSGAEIFELIQAAEKVCGDGINMPTLTLLKVCNSQNHTKKWVR